jgi:hypothetical protein
MALELSNETIRLTFESIGEGYNGSRFDWLGKLLQITWRNEHTFCTRECVRNATTGTGGCGLFGEFGLDSPIGFEETPVDSHFPKIGVGLLERPDDAAYAFTRPYKIKPFRSETQQHDNQLVFRCHSSANDRYRFVYEKRFILANDGFRIEYSLSNTGDRPLCTNEYIHNFCSINHRDIGPGYRLRLSTPFDIQNVSEYVNPDECVVQTDDKTLTWRDKPESAFFFGDLEQTVATPWWELSLMDQGLSISESADFTAEKINIWGEGHVVSTELFCPIKVDCGECKEWSRTYQIKQNN